MNGLWKAAFRFLGTHFVALVVTVLCLFTFSWLFHNASPRAFSLLTGLIYTALLYGEGRRFGQLEAKPYNPVKESPWRAAVAQLLPNAVSLLLAGLLVVGVNVSALLKVWYMMLVQIFPGGALGPWEVLSLVLFSEGVAMLGYFFGMKGSVLSGTAAGICRRFAPQGDKQKPQQ